QSMSQQGDSLPKFSPQRSLRARRDQCEVSPPSSFSAFSTFSAVSFSTKILAKRLNRLFCGSQRIRVRQRLHRGVAVVADVAQGLCNRRIIEVAHARRPAIRIDEMQVADVTLAGTKGGRDIDLFDVHVKQV